MDAVLFDMDDTLYDQAEPFAHAVRSVLGSLPASAGQIFKASRSHSGEVFAAYGAGRQPTDDMYLRRMHATLADFGVTISDKVAIQIQRAYDQGGTRAMTLSPAMAACLAWCLAHTRRGVGVVTNGSLACQMDKWDSLDLGRWVEKGHMFVSEALGVAKPDAGIFSQALESMGARAEQTLFVGDSYDIDVRGARGAGLRVVWIDRGRKAAPPATVTPRANWVAHDDEALLSLLKEIVR